MKNNSISRILKPATHTMILCFLLAGSALAQSNLHIRINVPFQFVAEDKTFAAGDYEITQLEENVLVMRNVDDKSTAVEKTSAGRCAPGTQGVTALVFHRINDHYFLEQVTTRSSESAHQLSMSEQENRMAKARPIPTLTVVSLVAHDNGIGGK